MKSFPAVRIEGGLFAPDLLDRLLAEELPGQKSSDFGLDGRRGLTDEIAAVFADAQKLWQVFNHRLERLPDTDPATSATRDGWVIPFLGLLGYELRYNHRAYAIGGLTFAISHRAGEPEDAPPVHIVGVRQELGRRAESGRPRLAPHALVQEYLNRSDALWGLVTNGRVLRLLRDSTYIRRQAYVEFDLEAIFEQRLFQDFAVLYRLLHRTRLPRSGADAHQCLLEQYYQHSVEQGGRVRERLREGVEACIKILANGFLYHPANGELRARIASGEQRAASSGGHDEPLAAHHSPLTAYRSPLTPEEFYHQLLRLVYRFLFLLVSEDRGLVSQNPLYLEHYGVSRFRRLVDSRAAYTDHDDLWLSLKVLWKLLSDDTPVQQLGGRPLASLLDLPVLNGELFEPLDLEGYRIKNRDLLEALWHLINYRETPTSPPQRVNYAALDVEELGSVYESLLDYHPVIKTSGSHPQFDLVYGSERKSTGSYYTPAELVNELIRSALDPVIEERLKDAHTPEEKERALLSIRVLDPASGSGHFLLAAARRLGKELAKVRTGEEEPSPEAVREAVRDVVAHCIYGVDKNSLAVELCRVALWLEAHTPSKPLTFLDHHIRCGDSLVGVFDLDVLKKGIPDEAFEPVAGDDRQVARSLKQQNRRERAGERTLPFDAHTEVRQAAASIRPLLEIPDDTPDQIRKKAELLRDWEGQTERDRLAGHLWTAAFFQHFDGHNPGCITTDTLRHYLETGTAHGQALGMAQALAQKHRFFHWPLEFPEVFEQGGFDVVLSNPPFLGGLKISGTLGDKYRHWLQVAYAPFTGTADLCAAFYRRAFSLLRPGGRMGMVATNTIGQGDTRESSLAVILRQGGAITFAKRFVKWPGEANVEVNLVAIHKRAGDQQRAEQAILDGQPVDFISSRLDDEPEAEPKRLPQNAGKAFQGDIVRGIGFVLEPEEAEALLAKDPRNADCLFPYLNGQDLNSHPEQKPSRWVICFHDWDLERARQYPDLLRIVEERVKPERVRLRGPGDKRNREYWWQFGAYRHEMRRAIASLRRVLVRALTSEFHMMVFTPRSYIFSHALGVFAFDDDYHFALLQSSVHEIPSCATS
ncbi:Eco57I restriction-modification methylase domain-containing protein [Thermus scotoductus]|uniref:Eco57I restriction-modification methylase domain-containing protein n=1 Tax=Thermus scotoductus TaxID=37636 RepID=UPI000F81045A|nr:DNA methyltransferase [Thermus scotoductus]RTI33587.1 restriction endonuclease [Thermus scotoductus]